MAKRTVGAEKRERLRNEFFKDEDAWTGSMVTDQVTRLNTRTGEMTDYLLPRSTNIRRVFVDNSTTPVSFWVGSNDGASIVRSNRWSRAG